MNSRQLTLAGMAALILFLAFMLRDAVEKLIVIPLAYLWWLFTIYYAALPQAVYWAFLAVIVFYSAVTNLMPKIRPRVGLKDPPPPAAAPIKTLAEWIKKSESGMYYKWLVANRLGKDAREILDQREGNPFSKKFSRLIGRDWNPPAEVVEYLENGLNGSFADFPRPKWFWQKQISTPLDVEAQQVVEYLEDEMSLRGASSAAGAYRDPKHLPKNEEIASPLRRSQ